MGWVIDRSGRVAAGALAAIPLAAVVVSACDQAPAPTASNTQAPPAPAPAELMGAPATAAPAAEAQAPPPAYAPPAEAPLVTMPPIPNPGDRGSELYYQPPHHRVHGQFDVAGASIPGPPTISRAAPKYAAPVGKPASSPIAVPTPKSKTPQVAVAAKVAPSHEARATPVAKVAVPADASKAAATVTSPLADLQSTLTSAIGQSAVLAAPDQFVANQPSDVTLTIPPSFAETVHDTAQKDGVGDAAASASVTALLSGQGYAVIPQAAQTIPLVAGKPTDFHWTVTAQPNAKGPLHTDVSTTLLGGGAKVLNLGSVQKPSGGMRLTPRIVGASLLFLIGGLVVAWFARGKGPNQSLAARRAAKRAARTGRPFDMSGGPPPT